MSQRLFNEGGIDLCGHSLQPVAVDHRLLHASLSWYKASDLTERPGSFTVCGLAGTSFSGLLQGVLHKYGVLPRDTPSPLISAGILELKPVEIAFFGKLPRQILAAVPQFTPVMALSSLYRGKWKAFSPNNLTGQWLSLAGGYAIEQVDYYPWPVLLYTSFSSAVALICIPVWDTSTLVTSGHLFTADVEDVREGGRTKCAQMMIKNELWYWHLGS
ncbi:hypothetical protein EDD17DRAFT_1507426 [Pisolithus thermaeus]|nr:hypothetical protein EV401DRAFT_1882129 [Pisolithus croceorrhizus]KAI6162935.1 hypothetical protein EDD17DRAFT_1507426 [Pisolithus thermaeus]